TLCTVSAPATYPLRGSITHPTQPLCTLRGRRRRRLTQHSLPGCLLGITWVGLSPTDRASFAWRLRRGGPIADMGADTGLRRLGPLSDRDRLLPHGCQWPALVRSFAIFVGLLDLLRRAVSGVSARR